jgi:starch synthase
MRVLMTAAEMYPYVKTGGLGDVIGALPAVLSKQDVDVRLLLPGYPQLLRAVANSSIQTVLPKLYFGVDDGKIVRGTLGSIKVYLLDSKTLYDRADPYLAEKGKDWSDNHLRFAALCHAAATISEWDKNWIPDVIHGHDWHCGLIPAYLKNAKGPKSSFIFTIHNVAYQGLFPKNIINEIGLPASMITVDGLEYYNEISFMKAGLVYSDAITTVSPQYAWEIQNTKKGCGLEGVLKARESTVTGILNGIDYQIWNPETDPIIEARYSAKTLKMLKDKSQNKKALLRETGLKIRKGRPLFGVVSRLVENKGMTILAEAAPDILQQGAGLIILGTGEKLIEELLARLQSEWPEQVSLHIAYDEVMAHHIIAGSDAIVIPSLFEPCGLVQLYGLRYGTLPVVRKTGGLADTVIDAKNSELATGFIFENFTAVELSHAMQRAYNLFSNKQKWKKIQKNGMKQDFSWDKSGAHYKKIYEALRVAAK